jgi:anti-sigma B factor antagonist
MSGASIEYEDLSEVTRHVKLSGRMDMLGSEAITQKLASLTASAARRVIIDLRDVTFMASIGIREIIGNAKAVERRGGKMVLLVGANEQVAKTLEATRVSTIVPTFTTEREALEAAVA